MRHRWRQLTAVLAAALLTVLPAASAWAEVGEKPEYWRAATYYSDDWVINFWNSESVHMEEELARIAADGFNSIVVAVPWNEFQPMDGPGQIRYEGYAYDKLDRVFRTAREQGLWVFLRVGYTWDLSGDGMDSSRFAAMLYDDALWEGWLDYVESLYQAGRRHGNLAGGFITWEDFWNFLQNTGNGSLKGDRTELAERVGYQEFLAERYTLAELEEQFGLEATSFEEIALPLASEPMFYTFHQFYDQFMCRVLEASQEVFPGLSMEVRLDVDPVPSADGGLVGASHGSTYDCGEAEYTAAMYSVSMGRESSEGDMTASEALYAMAANLGAVMAQNGGKPLFLEQFLFYDDTPEFSYNPKLFPGERPLFLAGAAPILRSMTNGYGVWAYRDYRNNSVYNSQFGLGERGWTFTGNAFVIQEEGNHAASLPAGGKISQNLGTRSRNMRPGGRTLTFRAESAEPVTITVTYGNEKKFAQVNGETQVELTFSQEGEELSILSSGQVTLDDVYFYNLVAEGLLYGVDGSERELIGAVRELNEELAE